MPELAQNASLETVILTVLAVVVIIILGGSIASFIVSIFQFIFSRGEADKITKAWNNIRYMIIGLILTIVLLFAFPFVFKALDVASYEMYTAKNIFKRAGELIMFLMNLTSNISDGLGGSTDLTTSSDLEL